jgi:GNAT superfamily N-acetyltransferase
MTAPTVHAPLPLMAEHQLGGFDCRVPSLNEWLQKRALKNQQSGASRTFVIGIGQQVVGYYCLAAGSVAHVEAPKALSRNMPDPIPVAILGRLAVDHRHQGQGLGDALLQDALNRTLHAAETMGIRAVLVHALSEPAKRFYLAWEFIPSPVSPMTLCLPLETVRRLFA